VTRSAILLNTLDHVRSRLVELRLADGKWQRRAVAARLSAPSPSAPSTPTNRTSTS
jgi:hypothetical protein